MFLIEQMGILLCLKGLFGYPAPPDAFYLLIAHAEFAQHDGRTHRFDEYSTGKWYRLSKHVKLIHCTRHLHSTHLHGPQAAS
jgi:hypothetical protein